MTDPDPLDDLLSFAGIPRDDAPGDESRFGPRQVWPTGEETREKMRLNGLTYPEDGSWTIDLEPNPDPLPRFVALTWFEITGRGPVAVVENPGIENPRELLNVEVLIDGALYRVRGVETHAVPPGHGALLGPFGLLVERVSMSDT